MIVHIKISLQKRVSAESCLSDQEVWNRLIACHTVLTSVRLYVQQCPSVYGHWKQKGVVVDCLFFSSLRSPAPLADGSSRKSDSLCADRGASIWLRSMLVQFRKNPHNCLVPTGMGTDSNEILLSLPSEECEVVFSKLEFVRLKSLQLLHEVGDSIKSAYFSFAQMRVTHSQQSELLPRRRFISSPE